jgi:hypothetical protein
MAKTKVKMTPERVQKYIQRVLMDAVDFMEDTLQGPRELADLYYQGGTDLPSQEGRSQVIVDCVRSGVNSVIPSIARIFTQTDTIVEFWTDEPQEERSCAEATVFCNHIYDKHSGYTALISMSTDALKARIGVVKVWVEKKKVPRHSFVPVGQELPALSGAEGGMLAALSRPQMPAQPMPPGMPPQGGPPGMQQDDPDGLLEGDPNAPQLTEADDEINVYTELVEKKIWHLDPIPPEEFIYDANATSPSDFQVMAHRRETTMGNAVALGYDLEDLLPLASTDDTATDTERNERRGYTKDNTDNVADIDPLSRTILLTEAYVWLDEDNDGTPELRRIVCGGIDYEILSDEPVNYIPFAVCKASIQPHVFAPISLAEDLIQDQDAQTAMLRSIIDNAALVNSPRTEANESKVNLNDLKNGAIAAIVRVKEMGQINELTTPSTAAQTLPVLQHLQEVSEKRTGITKLSQGIDSESLQSTSNVAAGAMVSASDARIEMMARNIGETGVKALFNTIMKVAMNELEGPQSVKVQWGYSSVNPSAWVDDMSIKVNVGLGSGRIDEKKAILQGLIQFQTAIIEKAGPANPLCTWDNVRNSWSSLLRLSGIHNTTEYLPYVPAAAVAQLDAAQKQASKQSSDMQIQGAQAQLMIQKQQADAMAKMVEVEAQKNQLKFQEQLAKLQQQNEADMQKMRGELMKVQVEQMQDMRTTMIQTEQKREAAMLKFFGDMEKLAMDRAQMVADTEIAAREAAKQTRESVQ